MAAVEGIDLRGTYAEDSEFHVKQYHEEPEAVLARPRARFGSCCHGASKKSIVGNFGVLRSESTRPRTEQHRGSVQPAGARQHRGSLEIGRHRGSCEADGARKACASKAAVLAVANQVLTGRTSENYRARMTHVRKSQRVLFATSNANRVPVTYQDTMKVNGRREAVLSDARKLSPISAVMHVSKLKKSIIPRLLSYHIVYVLLAIFALCAITARMRDLYIDELGGDIFGDESERAGAYDGASVLVTFMVVFYLGYCYSRYFEQYAAVRDASSTLVDIMINARVCLSPANAKLAYMYLNLMHATAYVGMTPVYNCANFLDEFIALHELASDVRVDAKLASMDFDHAGAKSFTACTSWVIELFHEAHIRNELDGESYRTMHAEVLHARSKLHSLYAYQHQVIPFVYSHLVSLACFLYLAFFAVEKGCRFAPEATYVFGLLVPLASFLITLVTTLGLVEIGQAIADPFGGNDPEDFAVPSFLNSCASLMHHACHSPLMDAPCRDELASRLSETTLPAKPSAGAPGKREVSINLLAEADSLTGSSDRDLKPRRGDRVESAVASGVERSDTLPSAVRLPARGHPQEGDELVQLKALEA